MEWERECLRVCIKEIERMGEKMCVCERERERHREKEIDRK